MLNEEKRVCGSEEREFLDEGKRGRKIAEERRCVKGREELMWCK